MKRLSILIVIAAYCLVSLADGGIPFFVNYTSDIYKAHNRNFDVVCDKYGTVYVANFEGLLYYDQAQWRVIHTPGISRVTSLFSDSRGRIWVGGYNVFGYLGAKQNGELKLDVLYSDTNKKFMGEVASIHEDAGRIYFLTSIGTCYGVEGNRIVMQRSVPKSMATTNKQDKNAAFKINQNMKLANGWSLTATSGKGLLIDERDGSSYSISEQNGLCNNNVNRIVYDGNGSLWGATDNGLFCVGMPSVFSRFTATEGLKGEVTAINTNAGRLYVGTMQGLFVMDGRHFVQVNMVTQAVWQITKATDGSLYIATSDGMFFIRGGQVRRLNSFNTLSVYSVGNGVFYTGEIDGVYFNTMDGQRKMVAHIEKANKLMRDRHGMVWIETVYGKVFIRESDNKQFVSLAARTGQSEDDIMTLFNNNGEIGVLNNKGLSLWDASKGKLVVVGQPEKEHFDNYPQFIYFDKLGKAWQTTSDGHNLGVVVNKKRAIQYDSWLFPLRDLTVSAMNVADKEIWIGGDFGLVHWASSSKDVKYNQTSNLYIRSVILGADSVIWGGYGEKDGVLVPLIPNWDFKFGSDDKDVKFTFSTDHSTAFGKTEYRYRLKGYNDWSDWSDETSATFNNLWYGNYVFQVMARDMYGRVTRTVTLNFYIQYPLYLRWYSLALYIIVFVLLVLAVIRMRMRRLLKEKMHLENIVEERTSELRQRNAEIVEKSDSLEQALKDLGNAQNELIHQEKMATVGKLTKGLIDRILNPMNYINNFSHLSKGLIKDVTDDLEDDKENMTPDIYDDANDVLSMVGANLDKIEQHGMNTTRILKAMEEMLKERKGNMQTIELKPLFSKIFEMVNSYHGDKIAKYHIAEDFANCPEGLSVNVNAEQLSKTLMSLIDNSVYALVRKYEHHPYEPLLKLAVEVIDGNVYIRLHDNGIGIEETIIDNIFDPFFTTKTTGEAAGVGLYLSREIILNFGGDISVKSQKDVYTEFVIKLPVSHEPADDGEENK